MKQFLKSIMCLSLSLVMAAILSPADTSAAQIFFDETESRLLAIDVSTGPLPAFCDFDNDGDKDIYISRRSPGETDVLLINGGINSGVFADESIARLPLDITKNALRAPDCGDIDGDGDLDIILGNNGWLSGQYGYSKHDVLLVNQGGAQGGTIGHFADGSNQLDESINSYDITFVMLFIDIDNDGDLDIFEGNYAGKNNIQINLGGIQGGTEGYFIDESAARLSDYNTIKFSQAGTVADVNNDGFNDIIIAQSSSGSTAFPNYLYKNNGNGTFTSIILPGGARNTSGIAIFDANGDGKLDIYFVNAPPTDSHNQLLINDGLGNFADESLYRLPIGDTGQQGAGILDVDNDGDTDILNGYSAGDNPNSEDSYILVNDGSGRFAITFDFMPTNQSYIYGGIYLVDVDSDGDSDWITSACCSYPYGLLLFINKTFSPADTTPPTMAPTSNKTILWPPDHKMVDVIIHANASDNSGGPVTLAASISSNTLPSTDHGKHKEPDWTEPIIDQSAGVITFQLRAERSGNDTERNYLIFITSTDESQNASSTFLEIIVPHDNGNK